MPIADSVEEVLFTKRFPANKANSLKYLIEGIGYSSINTPSRSFSILYKFYLVFFPIVSQAFSKTFVPSAGK